jgi:hypothetical protein
MPYKVELNRHTGNARLSYFATVHRDNIGKKGEYGRRIIKINGREYHVTKGWR